MPFSSISSMILAARLYPMRNLLCSMDTEACLDLRMNAMASSVSSSCGSEEPLLSAFSMAFLSSSSYTGPPPSFLTNLMTLSISLSEMYGPCTLYGLLEPTGEKSMSPFPSSFSAPAMSRMVLESTCEATLNAILEGMLALIRPVTTSTEGLWVATIRCIPAALAFCASLQIEFSTSDGAAIMRSASSSMMMTTCGLQLANS